MTGLPQPRRCGSSRRGRWHPWLFMLAFGTGVTALVAGDGGVALICGLVMFWTLGAL